MNITAAAIRYNRVTIVAVLALFVSGLSAYVNLPKAQDPGFTIRTATVTTVFPGASPERVEQLVTDAIEEKVQEMPEVDEITSESITSVSVVTVTFKDSYDDMQPIFDDLRQKVEAVIPELPSGVVTPSVNDEYGDTYGHLYSLIGHGFSRKELRDTALDVRDTLLKEPDIAKVVLFGDIEDAIYVEYNNARLTELGVSPQQLQGALSTLNILSSGGDITIGRELIVLEPTGNFDTVEDLREAIVEIPGSQALIRLRDIADIYRAYEDPISEKVRVGGEEAISLAISMRDGGNILTLGERLEGLTREVESGLPLGMELKPMFLQSRLTGASVDAFVSNLVQAVVIVIFVMILSLGVRTGLVVASLIPVVMVSTFVVMSVFSIGIDQISLAALIISLGLLVDNAIVVVEATIVRRQNGEEPIPAAINAAGEMMVPLIISSLTTAAAFTPIALAESAVGEFTASIFYVVTIALLLSWTMAMTFIPMLTPFIRVESKPAAEAGAEFDTAFYRSYRRLLSTVIRFPLAFCALVVVLFAASMMGMSRVPQVFIPPSEDAVLTATLELPPGSDIEATEALVRDVESFLESRRVVVDPEASRGDEIGTVDWTSYIGSGGPRFVLSFSPENPRKSVATLIVNVSNSASLDPIKVAIEQYVFENHPDARLQVKRLANGPPVAYPIEIKLSGPEFDELFALQSKIKSKLWEYDVVTAVQDTWGPQSKKLVVDVDQARAFRAGVSSLDIATSLNASLAGMEMTEFREQDETIPVVLRTQRTDSDDLSKLDNISVFSQSSGAVVPLSQVAEQRVVWEPARIERLDRVRMITIQVQLGIGVTVAEVLDTFRPWLRDFEATWKPGYSYLEGGETEESDKAAVSVVAALPFAAVAIVMLLILQFNSIRKSTIVLITIPLGLIGIVAGLLITGSSFGFFTFLGLISLAGIVINNAIVLLDRIQLEIDENGLEPSAAIVEASQQRARPILLTTATTIGGMIPLWLGGGPMFETMAVAILFGLLFATVITLLLVPVLYSVLYRTEKTGGARSGSGERQGSRQTSESAAEAAG
ncbi:MAG: efflux RND transporter permease subunit [Acidobacteriota bacterium]